jgi:hypothetical protein
VSKQLDWYDRWQGAGYVCLDRFHDGDGLPVWHMQWGCEWTMVYWLKAMAIKPRRKHRV